MVQETGDGVAVPSPVSGELGERHDDGGGVGLGGLDEQSRLPLHQVVEGIELGESLHVLLPEVVCQLFRHGMGIGGEHGLLPVSMVFFHSF